MKDSMTWSAGYPTEIEYTYGYYRELCPAFLRLACLSAGIATAKADPLKYLELGFGQGVSINIHAAGNDGDFWGTDFNPSQAAHARELAEASGSSATLLDASFADLAARPDLPDFDIIGLHGIWTWISEENSRVVVDIIRRKLKVGGLLYVSYNCLPGWAPAMPLRHLMKLHADLAAEAAGVVAKVDGAVTFAQQVIDSGALYFRANPAVGERLKALSGLSRNYLVHEYFTEDWRQTTFSDMARVLEDAKLNFVGSAHLLDHVEAVNLSEAGQKLLSGIGHPILRQSVRDYMVNQQFRRDIFAKGSRRLSALEHAEAFRQQPFVLLTAPSDIPMKVAGSLGEATLDEKIYRPMIESFAKDGFAPKTLGQISAHNPKLASAPLVNLIQAALVLTGAGSLHPAQEPTKQAEARSAALNRHLCERARGGDNFMFLASPVTGGGVPVNRQQQLFLLAAHNGKGTPAAQAKFVWDTLAAQGKRVLKGGKVLETQDENLAELSKQAEEFAEKRAPILEALGVAL
jgi:SAM-dependent methyltransferase